MSKVFISHSTMNKEIVKCFVDFLQMGMGIARNEIFCTSYPNMLPTGEGFIAKIKDELKDCEAVIFIITEEYLKSQFCLAELGAAWGLGKKIYPLLLVNIEKIERTPLKGVQVLMLNNKRDINNLYDEFCRTGIISQQCTETYMEQLPLFMEQLEILLNGDFMLHADGNGYYHTEISEVRNVPREYRCYKIRGHIEEWRGREDAKTDWLFYRAGVYEDLERGTKVKFKMSKMEINTWADIGKARNIYPADLEKE